MPALTPVPADLEPVSVTTEKAPSPPPRRALPDFEDDELREAVAQLQAMVDETRTRFESEALTAQVEGLTSFLDDFRAETLASLERLERTAREEGIAAAETQTFARDVRVDFFNWLARAIEAQVTSQEEVVKAVKFRAYLSAFDRKVSELPTLIVAVESARYTRQPGDSLGVRLLKGARRARRALRRLIGRSRRVEREVDLAELAAFYLGGPLGREIRSAANALAVLRVDLWRGSRAVIDRLEALFRYVLGRASRAPDVDGLTAARTEIGGELEAVANNLSHSAEALRDRLERRLAELLGDTGRAALLAGTWELPKRRYQPKVAIEGRRRDRLALTDNKAAWNALVRSTASALVMRLETETVLARFDELVATCRRVIRDTALSPVRDYPGEVVDQLDEARARLAEVVTGETDAAALSARLVEEHATLEGFITRIAVGETATALEGNVLNRPFDELFEGLERLLLDLPEAFDHRPDPWAPLPTDEPPPESFAAVHFPFRELCREVLRDEVRLRLYDRQKAVGLLLRDVASELTEIAHFLNFSFEAAAKALDGDKRTLLHELVVGGLEDAVTRTRNLALSGEERSAKLLDELEALAVEQSETLRHIVVAGDLAEAHRRVGQVGLAERSIVEEARLEAVPATALGRLRRYGRQRLALAQGYIEANLGLDPPDAPHLTRQGGFVGFTGLDESRIPRSYRRLFETAAFGVDDILAGQDGELDQLEAAVRRWRAGLPTTVIVVGERGSGRTTLIERALRRLLGDVAVRRRSLTTRLTNENALAEELARLLFSSSAIDLHTVRRRLEKYTKPLVLLLEGLQFAMLRTWDGLDPLRSLLNIVSRTQPSLMWLVTVDAAAWNFMSSFLGAANHFTHVVEVRRLSRHQTEQLVMQRHRISGFHLAYQPLGRPGGPGVSEPLPFDGGRQQRWFDALHRAAGGHPVSTMFAWLASIVEVTADNTVVLGPPRDIGRLFHEQLPTERLLHLAAIVMHGSLSEAEFAAVSRSNPRQAASVLGQLQSLNLIEPVTGSLDTYAVNPVLYRPLYERLRERRMI